MNDPHPTRRQFIRAAGGTLAAGMTSYASGQGAAPAAMDMSSFLESSGFSLDTSDSALIGIVADVHIFLNQAYASYTPILHGPLVAELNELRPELTHIVFAGDIISSHSIAAGTWRIPGDYANAIQEMRRFLEELERFRADVEIILVPGNHDVDNEENLAGGVPELWLKEIRRPPYQKRVLGGVPVFFLDSGHAGNLGPVQAEWFADEAASVRIDQEVLVVAHHPSFFQVAGEAGVKRKVAAAFRGHQAPVWLIGGHGHGFREALFMDHGSRFVQMEVTTGSHIAWSDGNSPGYGVLGLQEGRVVSRLFRSLKHPTFFAPRKPIDQMTPQTLRWPFDQIEYPAELFEEGEYQRAGKLVHFAANDLGTHLGYMKEITVKVNLQRFDRKVREFLLCASINPSVLPSVTCSFSETGATDSWQTVALPPTEGGGLFRIPIPPNLWISSQVFIKVETSLDRYAGSITFAGWGLAAAGVALTGYEKWIAKRYRTILRTPRTEPDHVEPGNNHPNIIRFAYNLPDEEGSAGSPAPEITGLPSFSETIRPVVDFRFARRMATSNPGIAYQVEESSDLAVWRPVDEGALDIIAIADEWEEVALKRPEAPGVPEFLRVRVFTLESSEGAGYPKWKTSEAAVGGGPPDINSNGIPDILEFAFALDSVNPVRRYDPGQSPKAGGLPRFISMPHKMTRIVFPKLRPSMNSGVTYNLESSADQVHWIPVPSGRVKERMLRRIDDWSEVEAVVLDPVEALLFYRLKLELTADLSL